MKEYYKIGEISALYGIGTDSLRYYEEIGTYGPSAFRWKKSKTIWQTLILQKPWNFFNGKLQSLMKKC